MPRQIERVYTTSDQLPPAFQFLTPESFTELDLLISQQVRAGQGGCLKLPIWILTGESVRIQERFKRIGELINYEDEKEITKLFTGVSLLVAGSKSRENSREKIQMIYEQKVGPRLSLRVARGSKMQRMVELMKLVADRYWDYKDELIGSRKQRQDTTQ